MKKFLAIILVICALIGAVSCTNIRESDDLASLLKDKGFMLRYLETEDDIASFLGYLQIEDTEGITAVVVSDGTDGTTPKPLMVIYCDSKATAERVLADTKLNVYRIADFFGVPDSKAPMPMMADNTVFLGDSEMIELAKSVI